MRAQQMLRIGNRRIMVGKIKIETGGDQPVLDRADAVGTLGVVRAHVVQQAVAVGDEGNRHGVTDFLAKCLAYNQQNNIMTCSQDCIAWHPPPTPQRSPPF